MRPNIYNQEVYNTLQGHDFYLINRPGMDQYGHHKYKEELIKMENSLITALADVKKSREYLESVMLSDKPALILEAGRGYIRWNCDICGELQEKDGMNSRIVFIYNDRESRLNICRECLSAGVGGAIERSIKNAEYLENLAADHRDAIPEVLREVSNWKSGENYDAVRNAFEETFMKEEEERAAGRVEEEVVPLAVQDDDPDSPF